MVSLPANSGALASIALLPGATPREVTVMLRIGYIVVPNFQVMIFGGLTVFEMANRIAEEPHYEIRHI